MNFSYAEKWSRSYKEAIHPLTEVQARKRHETRYSEVVRKRSGWKKALYTVLIGDPAKPSAFIEIVSFDSVHVEFLDELLRITGYYQFVMRPDGRLFMGAAAFSRFDDNGKKPAWNSRFSFKTDGFTMCFEDDPNDPKVAIVTEKRMDVSLNWEPYPEFGKYESIARFERGKSRLSTA